MRFNVDARKVDVGVIAMALDVDAGHVHRRGVGGQGISIGAGGFGISPGCVCIRAGDFGGGLRLGCAQARGGQRHVRRQLRLEAPQHRVDRAVVQLDEMKADLCPLRPGIGADGAAGVGGALAGQATDGLGALQGIDDLQHATRSVLGGVGACDPDRAVTVTGRRECSQGADDDEDGTGHGRRFLFRSLSWADSGGNPVKSR